MSEAGAARAVVRLALERRIVPVMGAALFAEYESVLARRNLFENAPVAEAERATLFDAFLSVSSWTSIYFLWRPNLRDEADNHIVELAVASNALAIITQNIRDFQQPEIGFSMFKVLSPEAFLEGVGER